MIFRVERGMNREEGSTGFLFIGGFLFPGFLFICKAFRSVKKVYVPLYPLDSVGACRKRRGKKLGGQERKEVRWTREEKFDLQIQASRSEQGKLMVFDLPENIPELWPKLLEYLLCVKFKI